MRSVLLVAVLVSAAPLRAQSPTVQQRFDAARQKLEADDAEGALAQLRALEADLKAAPKLNPANIAVTRAQQAEALIRLGRGGQAKALLESALEGDALTKPALLPVRENARLLLANIAEAELDHAAARREYLRLAAETTLPMTRTVALMGAARVGMFTDAPAALREVDQALALAESNPNVGKRELANVLGLKGRILINGGRHAEARALLVRAVSLRGGLTQRVFQPDVAVRADAAIAMLRLGQSEEARKYLAYTGAGRTEVQLEPPAEMPLPACGEEGLTPEDSAVIEFAILNDGRVVSPRPIYASKQGEAAYVFARAVQRWSWDAENASKVKPFFRLATRVELRCSNKTQRPPVTVELEAAMMEWFASKGVRPLAGESDATRLVELQPRLKAAPSDTPERLATLIWLSRNLSLDGKERLRYSAEAIALSERIVAPSLLRFVIALDHAATWAQENSDSWRGETVKRMERLQELRSRSEFGEPIIRAVINLQIAQAAGILRRDDEEIASLNLVAQSSELSPKHPLKVAALVQLANLYAARKQVEQARNLYELTGLSAKQCALVDGGPVLLRSGSGTFPIDAFNWGFEGWTSLEYDVAADGSTRNPRAVAAFPPRVFAQASEQIARTARYRVSYRPEGDLACTAMSRRVRFTIPS